MFRGYRDLVTAVILLALAAAAARAQTGHSAEPELLWSYDTKG